MKTYSITYKSITDPTKKEQSSLINELKGKNITILDEMPGSILIEAKKAIIIDILNHYPLWNYSDNEKISLDLPKKKIKKLPNES